MNGIGKIQWRGISGGEGCRERRRPMPRGSVLIFAVILLFLLMIIGTAFFMIAMQGFRAARNSVAGTQAEWAAEAGLEHALSVIRNAVLTRRILSPDGEFYRAAAFSNPPTFDEYVNQNDSVVTDPSAFNVFRVFEEYTHGTGIYAVLYRDQNADWCAADLPLCFSDLSLLREGETWDDYVYTTTPLTVGSLWPNSAPFRANAAAPKHCGWARRFLVDGGGTDPDSVSDPDPKPPQGFYSFFDGGAITNTRFELPKLSRVRGEYFVWIEDLDAKLYAIPAGGDEKIFGWGINAENSLDEYGDLLYGIANAFTTIADGILDVLNRAGRDDILPSTAWSAKGQKYEGLKLSTGEREAIRKRNASRPYHSIADFIGFLTDQSSALTTGGPLDRNNFDDTSATEDVRWQVRWQHLLTKAGMERYFTPHRDLPLSEAEKTALRLPFGKIKSSPEALNVNTATEETIAAALSQVPMVEGFILTDDVSKEENAAKAVALANRIVAKRPFLCRMDFEDFLAAHVAFPDNDGKIYEEEANCDKNPVSMIYYAIDKRVKADGTPDLTLAEYMEISGLAENHPIYEGVNTAAWQKKRFRWFNSGVTADALITPRAFNNLLNSVSSASGYIATDDVQVAEVGSNLGPFEKVIVPGADGELQTSPGGDDVACLSNPLPGNDPSSLPGLAGDDEFDLGLKIIKPGPNGTLDTPRMAPDILVITSGVNGIAESSVAVRPSYYSFWDDETYWTMHTPADEKYMKFYYGEDGGTSMSELQRWRAKPLADGENAKYPSYYQMSFDDSALPYGPMMAVGSSWDPEDLDPIWTSPYSAANPAFNNGDFSWSPEFCFRSRFFAVYVLAHGLEGNVDGDADPSKLRSKGVRRLEAVYDALKDKILWRRSQTTEKRRLSGLDTPQ
jgi:hypothetical protein